MYSRNGLFLNDTNNTNDTFSTPLKRLPNANVNLVLHEINEDIHKLADQHQEPNNASMSRSAQFSSIRDVSNLSPLSDASLYLARTRMQGGIKTNDRLFLKDTTESKPKPQVFYKPLYQNRNLLPQEFMPPKAEASGKITVPRLVSKPKTKNDCNLEDDDFEDTTPKGEWMSPIMKEALSRQVNKERIFRTLCTNVFRLVAFRLAILFVEYCYKLYQLNHQYSLVLQKHAAWARYVESEKSIITTVWPYVHHLQWIFLLAIAISIIRLLWPQDQCVDLPLTDKQRRLVGLQPLATNQIDEEGDDFTYKKRIFELRTKQRLAPPRYLKIYGLVGSSEEFVSKAQEDEPEIALSDILPSRTVPPPRQHVHQLPKEEQDLIFERFNKRFN